MRTIALPPVSNASVGKTCHLSCFLPTVNSSLLPIDHAPFANGVGGPSFACIQCARCCHSIRVSSLWPIDRVWSMVSDITEANIHLKTQGYLFTTRLRNAVASTTAGVGQTAMFSGVRLLPRPHSVFAFQISTLTDESDWVDEICPTGTTCTGVSGWEYCRSNGDWQGANGQ